VAEIIIHVDQGSQAVSIDEARGIRGRLTERSVAEIELRSQIGKAIRRAERGETAAVQVTPAMRVSLFAALAADKADRGLTPALSQLETMVRR
jgi:hypothetical protein